jgi:deoxyribonuclease-4
MPTGSQPLRALQTAREIGCDAIQIFVTNPRAWAAPEANPEVEEAFRAAAEALGWPVVVHAAYIINLASPRDEVFARSIALLAATLERSQRCGASSVVFHIGSHTGAGKEAGLARLAEGLTRVLDATAAQPRLLLENDTGGGGKLGYRLENLAVTLDRLPRYADRLGVCIDISHLWGAGFDVGTPEGATQAVSDLERVIGLARVPVLHVNDAREGLGSHRDVHARLGEGQIAREGMAAFLRHPALAQTTALLETPIPEIEPGRPDWAQERELMAKARALAGLPPLLARDATDEADAPRAQVGSEVGTQAMTKLTSRERVARD